MASARRVFLNGSPGLEFPGYRPPDNAEYVGPLVPARGALGPTRRCLRRSSTADAKVVAVSQGTVDNTDPTKLIVPTLEALKDGPYVVVATTGGAQTAELRDALRRLERRHRGLRRLRRRCSRTSTSSSPTAASAACSPRCATVFRSSPPARREGKNDINARIGYNRLGVDLRSERPRPARIRAAVRRVLADP